MRVRRGAKKCVGVILQDDDQARWRCVGELDRKDGVSVQVQERPHCSESDTESDEGLSRPVLSFWPL